MFQVLTCLTTQHDLRLVVLDVQRHRHQQVRPPALVPEQEADAAIPEQRRQVVPIRGRADEVLSGATSAAEHNRWCGGYPGLVRTLPPDLHRQPAAVDA